MPGTLFAATRKGLLTYIDKSGKWELTDTNFAGDPVTAVLDDARDATLYAALNLGHFGVKLHRSDDRGARWTELAAPAYPAITGTGDGQDAGPSVKLIWTLAAGGDDQPGCLWAGTIPGGLFFSAD